MPVTRSQAKAIEKETSNKTGHLWDTPTKSRLLEDVELFNRHVASETTPNKSRIYKRLNFLRESAERILDNPNPRVLPGEPGYRPKPPKKKRKSVSDKSELDEAGSKKRKPNPWIQPLKLWPRIPRHFGLIQERLPQWNFPGTPNNIYALVIQSILWNQTSGRAARPVLAEILALWPLPEMLALADEAELQELLYPIGLFKQRAKRLIDLGKLWLERPPEKGKRYRKVGYPKPEDGRDIGPNEAVDDADPRVGWEIAHLPGVGPYALDSFRIFCRDGLRKVDPDEGEEEEWKRVVPTDKDLRKYLVWRWRAEGWEWDPLTGKKQWVGAASKKLLESLKER